MIFEALAFNTSLFTLHEKFDSLGRNAGYALSNEVALITGTMQSFDQYGRLNQVTVDGITNAFTYGYLEGSHLQKTLAMPNGVTRTYGYEVNRDLLTMIVHSNATELLVQRDFTYDGLSRLANRTLFRANEASVALDAFAYNSRFELTNAIYQITQLGNNAIRQFSYDFDPIGNRNSATEFGTNIVYVASALNQYTSIQSASSALSADTFIPEFDADGNQTLIKTTTGIWHVTYNAENRPILFSNDTTVVEMAYDYMGRRCEYKETVDNILTRHERYLYRGYLQIAALDMLNSASVKHSIVWDVSEPVATRPLALQIGANAYYYSFEQVKNVTELFDSSGALSATYDYSPFGQVTSFQITQSGNQAITQFSNPLTFSSEIHDSTLGLQYYNYRHLNTLDGRWVNRDPVEENGGLNVYGFCKNELFIKTDVVGLIPEGYILDIVKSADPEEVLIKVVEMTDKNKWRREIGMNAVKRILASINCKFFQEGYKLVGQGNAFPRGAVDRFAGLINPGDAQPVFRSEFLSSGLFIADALLSVHKEPYLFEDLLDNIHAYKRSPQSKTMCTMLCRSLTVYMGNSMIGTPFGGVVVYATERECVSECSNECCQD